MTRRHVGKVMNSPIVDICETYSKKFAGRIASEVFDDISKQIVGEVRDEFIESAKNFGVPLVHISESPHVDVFETSHPENLGQLKSAFSQVLVGDEGRVSMPMDYYVRFVSNAFELYTSHVFDSRPVYWMKRSTILLSDAISYGFMLNVDIKSKSTLRRALLQLAIVVSLIIAVRAVRQDVKNAVDSVFGDWFGQVADTVVKQIHNPQS